MKRDTQAGINPFPYSDSNKRYHTFEYYLRQRFGEKCARISLDAGFTCPNIDGTCGAGGCIYCLDGSGSARGGGELAEQYAAGIAAIQKKWKCSKYIPYLQAHTNTYAPVEILRHIYKEASSLPGAVMLAIATRPDCLDPEVVSVLVETSRSIPVLVELGLQTIHDDTAVCINRGHSYSVFAGRRGGHQYLHPFDQRTAGRKQRTHDCISPFCGRFEAGYGEASPPPCAAEHTPAQPLSERCIHTYGASRICRCCLQSA